MLFTSLGRIIKSGWKSFYRNGSVSLASILIMIVTLSVILSLSLVAILLDSTLTIIKNQVDINIYFTTTSSEENILQLKENIEAIEGVSSVTYTSREQVFENFKERHKDDPLINAGLAELGGNPFRASITVKALEPGKFEAVASYLNQLSQQGSTGTLIDKVNYPNNKAAIDALARIINATNRLGYGLTIFFSVIAILITFNTIRLAIYTSRDEIAVMRLVGASRSYIRGPFLVAGCFYGLVSTVFVSLLFLPITHWLGPITEDIGTGINIFDYYTANFGTLTLFIFVASIVITSISAMLAIKKYLKV